MYYFDIASLKHGLTNQIFSFITDVIICYNNNIKVMVVEKFSNDFLKNSYSPISHILNLESLNNFLRQKYDVTVIDKNNANFELISINYGVIGNTIDVTNIIKSHFFRDNVLFIPKNIILNDFVKDPCFGYLKKIFINYRINQYNILQIFDEYRNEDISINNLYGKYQIEFGWIDKYNKEMFEDILVNIPFNDYFINTSKNILTNIHKTERVNLVHLRLEDDAIQHWSKENNMSQESFKNYIENKYIQIIKKYFHPNDLIIILSSSINNLVTDFLKTNNYNFKMSEKIHDCRELNAINDLLIASICNNIFIGNFNFHNLNGSSYSYYVGKILKNQVKKISIDLDHIYMDEIIY